MKLYLKTSSRARLTFINYETLSQIERETFPDEVDFSNTLASHGLSGFVIRENVAARKATLSWIIN